MKIRCACFAALASMIIGCSSRSTARCDNPYTLYETFHQRIATSHACSHGGMHTISIDNLACGHADRAIDVFRDVEFSADDVRFVANDTTSELLYTTSPSCSYGEPTTISDILAHLSFDVYAWCQRIPQELCE